MTAARNYVAIAEGIGRLVTEKQAAYGDSFGKAGSVMGILYPGGVQPEQLADALTVVRMLDKLFRIATDRDALGESPWRDIAGYALLAVERVERERTPREPAATDRRIATCAECSHLHGETCEARRRGVEPTDPACSVYEATR